MVSVRVALRVVRALIMLQDINGIGLLPRLWGILLQKVSLSQATLYLGSSKLVRYRVFHRSSRHQFTFLVALSSNQLLASKASSTILHLIGTGVP